TQTFSYTGAIQNFTVPAGITSITVNARGAAGSATGGSVVTKLIVTPGSTLNIYVGGAGTLGSLAVGGWNGGGTAGSAHGNEGSGGGASDIRIGGTALSNRVVIAGGGGGIGGYSGGSGGAGGGPTTGANGVAGQGGGGVGGTQSAGGAGGTQNGCGTGGAGSLGVGGAGGLCSFGGGGGGGGYYGGGGGGGDNNSCCADGGGGGGGSSYTDPTLTTGTTHTQGGNTGNGQVILSWTGGSTCPSPRTPVTVTITTPPTGGSITGTSTIVYGSSTGTMTLSGHTGGSTVVKWQKSLDKGSWADITNTTTTCSEIPTAPGTWQYRAQVTSSTCTAFSEPFSIVVTKKELTIGGTFTANNKTFNGNTTATIATNSLTLLTKVSSDAVSLTAAAVFDNKGVGTGKTVSLTGSALGGANADNYTLSLTGAPTATANITAIAPTLGGLSISSKTYGDPDFVLVNPTSNSSGSFSYTSGTTAVATVSGNTVTIVGAGTSTITATQAASDVLEGFASATTTATLTVDKANQVITLTLPTSAPLNSFTSSSVAITGTSTAGLVVTIAKSGTATATLNGTPGNYNLTGISSTGTLTFTATPAGDGNYNAATAISKSFDVTKNNQTITFSGSFPVTYTYTPSLTIDLSAAATAAVTPMTYVVVSGPATVSGTTLSVTGAGTVVIRASQAGDTNHNPAPDVNQNITINKATPTITFENISKVYSDTPFALGATSVSTGAFTYTSSVVGVATTAIVSAVSNATITGVGTTTLTATQAADANYNSATKDATLTVSKADQTITFGTPANKIEGDASFVLAATSNSGLAVSFASGTTSVASLSGTNNVSVTVGNAGTSTITASQAGDSHYNAATNVDRTLTVLACSNPTDGGTIATAQENCTNFDPAALTSSALPTGHPSGSTLEYQWQKSTTSNSAGFADITDATATTYDPSTISQTTWYRRLARVSCRAGWSGATASNAIAMTVSPTAGGTVTGLSSIAYNTPVTMTLSGHTGSVLKWQSSPDGTTWTDIANTTTTCTATPATVGTWQYRAQVQSYSCLVKFPAALSITVTANPLTISGISVVTKAYNGNTTATLTGTAVLVGVKGGETVTLGGTPVATFASRNAATGIAVSVTGYTISGTNASNYTLTQPAALTGNITAVQLTPHITVNDRPYNGLTTATLNDQSVTGMISGETVTLLAGAANFDTKDKGTGKTVTASSLTLGGTDAANYSLASGATATTTANITAVQLTPSITADNKPYDGNTTATLSTQPVSGMVNGETDVTLVVGSATFDNADKGTGKTVTATTLSLGGTKAGNYVLASGATATALANVTTVELTPHITASDKTYDGNTTATLSAQTVSGMITGETDVTLVVGAADFDTKAIGAGKTVTATSLTLGGTKAGNYTLAAGATATNTAAITTITLTPSITANDRPYNGTATATLSAQSVS
ncbi:MAG: hypothetical protein JZU60_04660, partial [Ilumatobacteraceae bacterium]|nr:hypothetical protein [Ilumatobacteraceae bacterium]